MDKKAERMIQAFIQKRIWNHSKWMIRSFVIIWNNQTPLERKVGESKGRNGVGFDAIDDRVLSEIAFSYLKSGMLTRDQKSEIRKRIVKYWRQLWRISDQNKLVGQVLGEN